LVAIAAYLAGASHKRIDTEDIAIKSNEIAPGRFSWRKYKDQIDLELIYKHLWDLTKEDKGEYLAGSKNEGWMLTPQGISFAERAVASLKDMQQAPARLSKKQEDWIRRERARMLADAAYLKITTGREAEVTRSDAERFFRLDDYIVGEARNRKILLIENAFRNDPELSVIVTKVSSIARNRK